MSTDKKEVLSVRVIEQKLWRYSRVVSLEKSKYILKNKLIKYNPSLEKSKRIK